MYVIKRVFQHLNPSFCSSFKILLTSRESSSTKYLVFLSMLLAPRRTSSSAPSTSIFMQSTKSSFCNSSSRVAAPTVTLTPSRAKEADPYHDLGTLNTSFPLEDQAAVSCIITLEQPFSFTLALSIATVDGMGSIACTRPDKPTRFDATKV